MKNEQIAEPQHYVATVTQNRRTALTHFHLIHNGPTSTSRAKALFVRRTMGDTAEIPNGISVIVRTKQGQERLKRRVERADPKRTYVALVNTGSVYAQLKTFTLPARIKNTTINATAWFQKKSEDKVLTVRGYTYEMLTNCNHHQLGPIRVEPINKKQEAHFRRMAKNQA